MNLDRRLSELRNEKPLDGDYVYLHWGLNERVARRHITDWSEEVCQPVAEGYEDEDLKLAA